MDKAITTLPVSRRKFVATSIAALGIPSLVMTDEQPKTTFKSVNEALTVQHVIDIILKEIPGAPFDKTVDTLKSGNPGLAVKGIVTTMFATVEVIKKAIELNANFIIAHEPTFYNHLDETSWLEDDKVYSLKRGLLEKNNIAVWRFHDYLHTHRPDGVLMGVLTDLDWKKYYDEDNPVMLTLPPTSVRTIMDHVKGKLGIRHLRFVGDPEQVCRRVLLMPGAAGGRSQIQRLKKEEPDLLICGEVAEWETSEYIRDAQAMGLKRSLIVLGHAQSEEPGMEWMVQWLQPKVKGINVTHVPSNNPFTWA
jgi:putative NIF3 family GTP cyclohydrolase 1 type 2